MKARRLVDESFVTLDIGCSHAVEGVVLPRYSTWMLNSRGVPSDLLALAQLLPVKQISISEELTSADEKQVLAVVRRELKKVEKDDKKDDLELVKNVLISLFKTFYTKRSFWSGDLKGDRSS